jgi:hypothetical protein
VQVTEIPSSRSNLELKKVEKNSQKWQTGRQTVLQTQTQTHFSIGIRAKFKCAIAPLYFNYRAPLSHIVRISFHLVEQFSDSGLPRATTVPRTPGPNGCSGCERRALLNGWPGAGPRRAGNCKPSTGSRLRALNPLLNNRRRSVGRG